MPLEETTTTTSGRCSLFCFTPVVQKRPNIRHLQRVSHKNCQNYVTKQGGLSWISWQYVRVISVAAKHHKTMDSKITTELNLLWAQIGPKCKKNQDESLKAKMNKGLLQVCAELGWMRVCGWLLWPEGLEIKRFQVQQQAGELRFGDTGEVSSHKGKNNTRKLLWKQAGLRVSTAVAETTIWRRVVSGEISRGWWSYECQDCK